MIIKFMTYTMTISLLIGFAAWLIERAISGPAWPRRWLWAFTMAVSLAGSAAMVLRPHPLATESPVAAMVINTMPVTQLPAFSPVATVHRQRVNGRFALASITELLEAPAKWAWISGSLLLLGAYAAGAIRLRRAKRAWKPLSIGGYGVWVTENVGPAVMGFRTPVIVVPQWLLNAPGATRDVALIHEHEHIAARDSRLLFAALLWLALTPWNLPLWWQFRRLKLAIEVDCDRRVIERGVDRKRYAHALLGINQRSGRMPMAAIAIVGRASQVERRISSLVAARPKYLRVWVTGWATAAIPLLVVAADIEPPSAQIAIADSKAPHALLGIGIAEFDVNGAARAVATHHTGVLVTYVHPGGAGDLGGLKAGDVIVEFGHRPVSGMTDLLTQIAHTAPNATTSLEIQRGPERKASVLTIHFLSTLPERSHSPGPTLASSDWDKLRDKSLPIANPQLQAELIRMSGLDQMEAMQNSMSKEPPLPPNTAVIRPTPWSFDTGSASNVRRLNEIIAKSGWPTISMVGVRGARGAAMIAIESRDVAFESKALALMEPLILRDEIPANEYAMLYDLVHTPQRFGTQADCKDGVMMPSKAIEDPVHLDARRTALGLFKLPQVCRAATPASGSIQALPASRALIETPTEAPTPRRWTYSFKDADISDIAAAVNKATHKTFVIDPRVHARVTISSSTPVSPEEFYQNFKAALEEHGLIAVPDGDAIKILPDDGRANSAPAAKSATSVSAVVSAGTAQQVNLPLAWKVQDGLFSLDKEPKLQFSADTATEVQPGTMVLEGHVRITGQGTTIASDKAVITHTPNGGSMSIIVSMANGTVQHP